jgi:putative DNA primase/helicase
LSAATSARIGSADSGGSLSVIYKTISQDGRTARRLETERASRSAQRKARKAEFAMGTTTTIAENASTDNGSASEQSEPKTSSSKRPASKGRHRCTVPVAPDLLPYPHTDTGNAERLVAMYGGYIRFCPEWKKWLVWDGTRWKPDSLGVIRRYAKQVIRTFYAQAAGIPDSTDREKAEAHARRSENAAAIRSMLSCAESEATVTVSAGDLDRDPWLLNCKNGTLNLRTCLLQQHRQADLITKLCPGEFDLDATCPQFERFITRILPGLTDYLQRVMGYALTGVVTEKACFCLFGEGNNGKTTLLELFRYILGDYAAQVMIDSLMTRRSQESNTSLADLADLRGARFVTTSETEEGQRLAEGKLKFLTGMSEIKTCRKYENPVTFPPTHKIFMDANHRPAVRGSDAAIWNRLKLIPFGVSIPAGEIDKDFLTKLKAETSGVLTWAVTGYLDWQDGGLAEPQAVQDAVGRWKTEDDPYREFFEDECEFGPAHWVPVKHIWQGFSAWAKDNGIQYASRRKLHERLRLRGCSTGVERDATGRQLRVWKGIRLVPPVGGRVGGV